MVSPFEVYVVLQLSAVKGLLFVLAIASVFCAIFSAVQWADGKDASPDYAPSCYFTGAGSADALKEAQAKAVANAAEKRGQAGVWLKRARNFVAAAIALTCVAALTPSSRTAAAMFLIPKLTSPEVLEPIGAEAKELYGLAKQALRKLGDEPEPEAK